MLGCAVREIGATLVSRQRLLQPTTRNITTHCATAVHQKHDDPGHPALDAAGYYFDASSSPANLVLWSGSMFICFGLAPIGSTKRATSRRRTIFRFERGTELANLVLWSGTMPISFGLAPIGSTKRETSRRQTRVHLGPEIRLSLDDARASTRYLTLRGSPAPRTTAECENPDQDL